MQNCNCTAKLAFLAMIAAGLLAVPPEIQAQEPPEERENYALITHTNGMTWKEETNSSRITFNGETRGYYYYLSFWSDHEPLITEIVVPENALINEIHLQGCVNLTNIVIHPKTAPAPHSHLLSIYLGRNNGLRNITCYREMRDLITISGEAEFHAGEWSIIRPVQWTELFPWVEPEPPKIEIKTHAAANGKEVEIVWRDGTLQTANAVNGKWKNHIGISPLRFPLVINSKDKQFFRIARIESPTTEEPPTPQTFGGNR